MNFIIWILSTTFALKLHRHQSFCKSDGQIAPPDLYF
jgi:hypothetical protein